MPSEYNVGDIRRTLFATWRVERCDRREVSFPFGTGFGCGQTVKISQGYKHTLQTQLKSTLQSGLKIAGPVEISTTSSMEQSVTIGYEFTSSQEWSYTAPACEYCTPDIVFPEAVVTVWSKRPLHIPVFVSKLIDFYPGPRSEIRGNCRKDPKRCHNCADVTDGAPGTNPILVSPNPKTASQIHHVVLAQRVLDSDPADLLDGVELSKANQLFFVGLEGELVSAAKDVVLLCIDDVDRTLGTVRLDPYVSRLYFLLPETESEGVDSPSPILTSNDRNLGLTVEAIEDERLAALGFRLLGVDIVSPHIEERSSATLSLRVGRTVHQWPITTFPLESTYAQQTPAPVTVPVNESDYGVAEANEAPEAGATAREYGIPVDFDENP